MRLFWMIIAGVAIVIAAVLLWLRNFNAAFVVAAIGLVAWFLNYRIQMQQLASGDDLKHEKEEEPLGLDED